MLLLEGERGDCTVQAVVTSPCEARLFPAKYLS